MKRMLHKRFDPAKCKTALMLAASRAKVLKNKKEVQFGQLKRDVAQLLQSGQQQTAMIRVQHVIREEKTIAAYDLIEIYCELVVAHLPIIASQKNCPINLKEAITSIIFASPRCADIPELVDVRKHFSAKYGKEFVTAATELHSECSVNRILFEKLSAVAPDDSTKLKVLSAIAHDHNIEWEPIGLKEKDPEPPRFILHAKDNEKGSMIHVEPPRYQAVPQIEKKQEITPQYHCNKISEAGPSVNAASTGGHAAEVMGSPRSSTRIDASSRPAWQNWNMDFKDATAAAQAAAESAERASMAARVAAELSSHGKILNHNSTTSTGLSGLGKDVDQQEQDGYALQGQDTPRKSAEKKSFEERSSILQAKQINSYLQEDITATAIEVGLGKEHSDSKEQDNEVGRGGNRERSHTGLVVGSHEFVGSASSYQPESESEDESDENPFYEETTQVPSSYDNQSSASIEEHGVFSDLEGPTFDETFGNSYEKHSIFSELKEPTLESGEQPGHSSSHYGVIYDEDKSHPGSFYEEVVHVKSDRWLPSVGCRKAPSAKTGAVFHDYASEDDDDSGVYQESEHNMQASASSVTSPNRKWLFSPGHSGPPADSSVKFPISSKHLYDPEIVGTFKRYSFDSQWAEPQPVIYDDSDGPSSDEEETEKFKTGKKSDSWTSGRDTSHSAPAVGKTGEWTRESNAEPLDSGFGNLSINRRSPSDILNKSSSDDFKESFYSPAYEVIDQQHLQSSGDILQPSPQPMIGPESTNQTSEVSTNLNLGPLTGSRLRNKGYMRPPYRVDPLTEGSTSGMGAVESLGVGLQPSSDGRFENPPSRYESAAASKPAIEYTWSDSDTVKVKPAEKGSGDISKAYNMETDAQMDERFRLRAPAVHLDSSDSGSEEGVPEKAETTRVSPVGAVSRRTRGSAPSSTARMDSNSKVSSHFESSSAAAAPDRKPSSPSSGTGTLLMSQTRTMSSGIGGNPQVKSGPVHRGKMALQEETLVPSVVEKQTTDSRDMNPGDGTSKDSSISTPLRVDSTKKASHVHPSLPDYDTLAAHFRPLRKDRL